MCKIDHDLLYTFIYDWHLIRLDFLLKNGDSEDKKSTFIKKDTLKRNLTI